MNENLSVIVGVELLCAAQGIEFRAPLTTSPRSSACSPRCARPCPPLGEDRYMADDLARAAGLVRDGRVTGVCGIRELLGGPRMTPVEVTRGDGPVVLGMPHTGTWCRPTSSRGSTILGGRWPIPTGTSTGSTTGSSPAPRSCGRPSTATSSTRTARRTGRASIRGRTPRGFAR
jgi:hypothetical protein